MVMDAPHSPPNTGKRAAGIAAAAVVEDGMVLGLGSGSTVAHFLRALAERDLDVSGVATSVDTANQAEALGLQVRSVEEVARVDLVVDGADEMTPDLMLTKGGGAALLREKVVAQMAARMLVIATPDKVVARLAHTFALPIEVVTFAVAPVRRSLEARGYEVSARDGQTDNGNSILDARFPGGLVAPADEDRWLSGIAGIAEHGLFIDLATAAVLGSPDGTVSWIGTLDD